MLLEKTTQRIITTLIMCCIIMQSIQLWSQNFFWAKAISGTNRQNIMDIQTDVAGNVIIVGIYDGTFDIDPDAGVYNLTFSGGVLYDAFIAKYTSTGSFLWAIPLSSTGMEVANSVEIDASGNIYVTGSCSNTTDFDPGPAVVTLATGGFVAKYSSAGALSWVKGISPQMSAISIKIDNSGNSYVCGHIAESTDFDPGPSTFIITPNSGSGYFIPCVFKLDPSGNFVWAKAFNNQPSTTTNSFSYDIAIDASQNVYVTGVFKNILDFDPGAGTYNLDAGANDDAFVVKLNSAGNFVWAANAGSASGTVSAYGITLDNTNNIYVTGYTNGTNDFDPGAGTNTLSTISNSLYIWKLSNTGALSWAANAQNVGFAISTGNKIAYNNNALYVVGYFASTVDFDMGTGVVNMTSTAGTDDIFVASYNLSGGFNGIATCQGNGNWDRGVGIYVDASNNIFYCGYFENTVDFDPGSGTFNLTSSGGQDGFFSKISICTPPAAPTNTTPPANLTICQGNSTTLNASGTSVLSWYNAPSGGTWLGSGSSINTSTLTSTTTFYVQDSTCAASTRTAITVTVKNNSSSTINHVAFQSYTWFSNTYTTSGTYTHTLPNAVGCDSVITLNLIVTLVAGDLNGDGDIDYPTEVAGDVNMDGDIDYPTEIAGDVNGDGVIDYPTEVAGDTNGDGDIDYPTEVAGDTNGDGDVDYPTEVAGDLNGNGVIDIPLEHAGDTNGDGDIDYPTEVNGDTNGDGDIDYPTEVAGDTNGDGDIDYPTEVAGDTNGNGDIDYPTEVAGDTNGNGDIDYPTEVAGDTNGNGNIDYPTEVAGDTNGNGDIDYPTEVAGDTNGNGDIDPPTELAGDTNGDGTITPPEIGGDTNGDGTINGSEIEGDVNNNGIGYDCQDREMLQLPSINNSATANNMNLSCNIPMATYQWINCANNQPVAGATSQTFTATVEGNYAVIVTVGNCTDTSNCVVAGYASIETTEGFSIQLYPNPARNFIQIQSSDLIQNIECLDLQGKLVRVYTANSLQFTMNVSELKNGIYIFGIKTNKGLIYKRIVVFHE